MRELEFRIWVEGYRELCSVYSIDFNNNSCEVLPYEESEGGNTFTVVGCLSELEQYTGLKDKNGNKVFEGDIVNYKKWFNGYGEDYTEKTTIIDIEYNFFDDESVGGADGKIWYTDVEIIGNIHTHNEDGTKK